MARSKEELRAWLQAHCGCDRCSYESPGWVDEMSERDLDELMELIYD